MVDHGSTAELMRSALRDPPHWPSFLSLGFALALIVGWFYWWLWVPSQPFELHIEPPIAVNPITGHERSRWQRGETLGVRYHTQILQDCRAVYERWLRRADGLSYGPDHLGAAHGGHYRARDYPLGRTFVSTIQLPTTMRPGEYSYTVRVTAHCSPLRATVETSPPVLIEVR